MVKNTNKDDIKNYIRRISSNNVALNTNEVMCNFVWDDVTGNVWSGINDFRNIVWDIVRSNPLNTSIQSSTLTSLKG